MHDFQATRLCGKPPKPHGLQARNRLRGFLAAWLRKLHTGAVGSGCHDGLTLPPADLRNMEME